MFKEKRCLLIKLYTKNPDEILKSLMFYARVQTHLQPEITCYLETDNKKQDEVDQEIFRVKGFIQINS